MISPKFACPSKQHDKSIDVFDTFSKFKPVQNFHHSYSRDSCTQSINLSQFLSSYY